MFLGKKLALQVKETIGKTTTFSRCILNMALKNQGNLSFPMFFLNLNLCVILSSNHNMCVLFAYKSWPNYSDISQIKPKD